MQRGGLSRRKGSRFGSHVSDKAWGMGASGRSTSSNPFAARHQN